MTLEEAHALQRKELLALRREVNSLRSSVCTLAEKEQLEKENRKLQASLDALEKKYREIIDQHLADAQKINSLIDELDTERQKNIRLEKENERLSLDLAISQAELDELKETNKKLTVQANKDFTNSSFPSSAKPFRRKIPNSRVPSGKKPGGQPGHKPHRKHTQAPTKEVLLPAPECADDPDLYRTGKVIHKKLVDITFHVSVTDYSAEEYRRRSNGSRCHAPFPAGVDNEINYGPGVKAMALFLNQYCNVPVAKTTEFLSAATDGAVSLSAGMVCSLAAQFTRKSRSERLKIFKQLAGASTLYTDNTGANVNGSHKVVFVSTDKDCVLYQYRSSKGDAGIQGTPVEVNPNTLVHDHDVTFYHYGSHHQECLAHVLRCLIGAKENEPDLTWHGKMHKLLQEMIVFAKENRDRRKADDPQVRDFRKHYLEVLRLGEEEYRKFPPDNAFRDGFNLCSRMRKYMDDHLFFLSHPEVDWTNNVSERRLRLFKRKQKQAVLYRSTSGPAYTCNVLTITETARARNRSPMRVIRAIFAKGTKDPDKVCE